MALALATESPKNMIAPVTSMSSHAVAFIRLLTFVCNFAPHFLPRIIWLFSWQWVLGAVTAWSMLFYCLGFYFIL